MKFFISSSFPTEKGYTGWTKTVKKHAFMLL